MGALWRRVWIWVVGFWAASLRDAAAPAAWRADTYVWQRAQGEAAADAVAASRERVSGFYPLAAEVSWTSDGAPHITRIVPDYVALASAGRSVGPVLRIAPFAGPFARDDAAARALAKLARGLLAETRSAGVEPAELQVDFDCAERTLAGYREWLLTLRGAAAPTPLVFTALPAWLRHADEFAALAAAADGFVLPVHSLEKPADGPDAVYSLVNYDDSLRWARDAARIAGGRAFRVAMPTYGYRLAFDADGRFFALSAEGPAPRWPAGTITRTVRSDPVEMLRLERALADAPPPGCAGVIWFRLPVAGDRLNWEMPTFLKVLSGEAPVARLELEASGGEEKGLVEIVAVNRGDTSEPLPGEVKLAWFAGARLLASDGLGGYEIARRGVEPGLVIKDASAPREDLLGPGKSRRIAWLRFADETPLEISTPHAAR